MKALAASSIGQYEKSVQALADYDRTVELGLAVCLRNAGEAATAKTSRLRSGQAIVFGSDQGLVGQFNDLLADLLPGLSTASRRETVWAVGERVRSRLADVGLTRGLFTVPTPSTGSAALSGRS